MAMPKVEGSRGLYLSCSNTTESTKILLYMTIVHRRLDSRPRRTGMSDKEISYKLRNGGSAPPEPSLLPRPFIGAKPRRRSNVTSNQFLIALPKNHRTRLVGNEPAPFRPLRESTPYNIWVSMSDKTGQVSMKSPRQLLL